MTELILGAARELGIEQSVRVNESSRFRPLVYVTEGTKTVQQPIDVHWLMDSSLTQVKQILKDMHQMAKKLNEKSL
jgi:hypothetical protein